MSLYVSDTLSFIGKITPLVLAALSTYSLPMWLENSTDSLLYLICVLSLRMESIISGQVVDCPD